MATFYVTHTTRNPLRLSTRWGAANRGQYYKSRTPETVSYGPFDSQESAQAWANLRGVLNCTIQNHGIGRIITVGL